jgi:transcriptional regulator with GAF, ATPase, and Fis domain/PAS domain-containing protein
MATIADPARKLSSGLLALKRIVEGTSEHTGEKFFQLLVRNLAESLDAHGVWVTEYIREKNRLRSLAFWLENKYVEEYEYDLPGTPCEVAMEGEGICHIPENVISLFPDDNDLRTVGAVSYMGLALRDENNNILGHLALLDNKPMAEIPEAFAIFNIFAARAAAEMRRLRYEKMLIENEAKLNRLVNGTREALIELNERLIITQANQAALFSFRVKEKDFTGRSISDYFDAAGFRQIVRQIAHNPGQKKLSSSSFYLGILTCIRSDNKSFPAETSISKYCVNNQEYHALFIRNIEERFKAENDLKQLNAEAAMLREKLNARNFDNIIGESRIILKTLEAVEQVAPLDSTVLIRGETGTGKELFARAIHKSSNRKDKQMVTLNCATLPSELVESELFGHVKGAFTGAANSREGRFKLADGGTIFLDEIGELPLSLQAKLLRVLQEGEFEPVGSSVTQKVNVRVIAATNRNLEDEIKKGRFRQDLYYRLNVFPFDVPPLRDRGNDIILLAEAFLAKFAGKAAITIDPLDEASKQRLLSYNWPGNVRELQNIIERCVITSRNGKIDLISILPGNFSTLDKESSTQVKSILTDQEMIDFEKQNIIRALEMAGWKVSGDDGAAALLKIPATTLSSRIRKLGIRKFPLLSEAGAQRF